MTEHMNMLFLMTDQHRVDTLGCYGNPRARTPNLDALAAGGARLDANFAPSAVCTPARASLAAGGVPFRHGLLANDARNVGDPEDPADAFTPLAQQLGEAGCDVGA